MNLTILGAGVSSHDYQGAANTYPPAFVLESNNTKLLIECSEGTRFRLTDLGFDYGSFEHVFISHSHPDHYALPQYVQSVFNREHWGMREPKRASLNIYSPKTLAGQYRQLWEMYQPDLPDLPNFKINFTTFPSQEPIKIDDIKITAEKVYHGFGRSVAVSFRFEAEGKTFAYSGDTGECEGVRPIAQDADAFLCECSGRIGDQNAKSGYGHPDPFAVGDICKNSGVKKAIIFHYTGLDSPENMEKEIRRSGFEKETIFAKDGQIYEL